MILSKVEGGTVSRPLGLLLLVVMLWWHADDSSIKWEAIELESEPAILVAPGSSDLGPERLTLARFANVIGVEGWLFGWC